MDGDKSYLRAFASPYHSYYFLQQELGGILPVGTVFVWDRFDNVRGSPAEGCLKLCWTSDGNCFRTSYSTGLCAESVVFHASFRKTPMFKLADNEIEQLRSRVEALEKKVGI